MVTHLPFPTEHAMTFPMVGRMGHVPWCIPQNGTAQDVYIHGDLHGTPHGLTHDQACPRLARWHVPWWLSRENHGTPHGLSAHHGKGHDIMAYTTIFHGVHHGIAQGLRKPMVHPMTYTWCDPSWIDKYLVCPMGWSMEKAMAFY